MNREMLPFILFLLYSEDLKTQANRIISGIKSSGDESQENANLFNKIKDQLSEQYNEILTQVRNSSDPQTIAAELKQYLNDAENSWYRRVKDDLERQYTIISSHITKSSQPKLVAAEIIERLKSEESEFFDRAANYVYMYYTEIMEEIKANSNIKNFSQEISRQLRINNEILMEKLSEQTTTEQNMRIGGEVIRKYADEFLEYLSSNETVRANQEFQKNQMNAMNLIKESVVELTEKINLLTSDRNSNKN